MFKNYLFQYTLLDNWGLQVKRINSGDFFNFLLQHA